ncbi:MAG: hypothetical protein ABSE48_19440 [Verrucomicrobiota bacterium]
MDVPQNSLLLTNWSVQAQSPLQGFVAASNKSVLYVNSNLPPDGLNLGTIQQSGQLTFAAVSNRPSAYLPLRVADGTALRADGITDAPLSSIQDGYVVVLNRQSCLHLSGDTNGLDYITLYGFSGTNYTIESATNLKAPIKWQPVFDLTPSDFIGLLLGLPTNDEAIYQPFSFSFSFSRLYFVCG